MDDNGVHTLRSGDETSESMGRKGRTRPKDRASRTSVVQAEHVHPLMVGGSRPMGDTGRRVKAKGPHKGQQGGTGPQRRMGLGRSETVTR